MVNPRALIIATGFMFAMNSYAASSITNGEAGSGLKAAITRGSEFAVTELGKKNGFLGNSKVRIELPPALRRAEDATRKLGFGKQADELVDAMNHAAEAAVVEAKPILISAAKKMSFKDAKDILLGGPNAATEYFKRTTSAELSAKFLPVVKKATSNVGLAQKYNDFAGKAARLGLLNGKDADLDTYVTRKTLDGLFIMIAEQEKQIRNDPIGTGSSILKKVFGSIER